MPIGAINRIDSGTTPEELMRRATKRLARASLIDREYLLDAAIRNEARRSSLPYLRSLRATLGLLNRPEPVAVKLIREEFQRLLSRRSALSKPESPNATGPNT